MGLGKHILFLVLFPLSGTPDLLHHLAIFNCQLFYEPFPDPPFILSLDPIPILSKLSSSFLCLPSSLKRPHYHSALKVLAASPDKWRTKWCVSYMYITQPYHIVSAQ
jgi:hypothetical protein